MNIRRFLLMKMLNEEVPSPKDERDGVWVDGEILRRFVSCEDDMKDILSDQNKPILRVKDRICETTQEGLHPRITHHGKLLSKKILQFICPY